MTTARKEVYDSSESGWYHCISRCVRRAFLCGNDPYTGKSFEHRKSWVRERLAELLNVFAIDCLAYAVMSSHLHTVLCNKPEEASKWSSKEVAQRWRTLFPKRRTLVGSPEVPNEVELLEIMDQPILVQEYRKRLCDLSWFQRCLNQEIACRANAEDDCTGRFWEGRFKCTRLEDEAALLTCSIYVDLNPIRAGIAKTPESSEWTSIHDRILKSQGKLPITSAPRLVAHSDLLSSEISEARYIELVEETGRILVHGKGSIPQYLLPILKRLGIKPEGLILNSRSQSKLFHLVVGRYESLRNFARKSKKLWVHGLSSAKAVFA